MAYHKNTLRRMAPLQRRAARLEDEMQSVRRRMHNVVADMGELERETGARRRRDGQAVNACPQCGYIWPSEGQ